MMAYATKTGSAIGVWASMVLALTACDSDVLERSPCSPSSGIVSRVLDGDTIELQDGEQIRYLLVDTPEIAHNASEESECFGEEARIANERLVLGKEVYFTFHEDQCYDRFDRLLAYVWLDGHLINRAMLERGYGWVLAPESRSGNPYVYENEFRAIESAAQRAYAGLWGFCQ